MNKRRLRLKESGISDKRYMELKAFCEQYPEWKDKLKHQKHTVKSIGISDAPLAARITDQTQALAMEHIELEKKCKMIEQTAIEADADLYSYIIQSVCYEAPYKYLQCHGIPCSRASFYDARRHFFYLLNKNKKM